MIFYTLVDRASSSFSSLFDFLGRPENTIKIIIITITNNTNNPITTISNLFESTFGAKCGKLATKTTFQKYGSISGGRGNCHRKFFLVFFSLEQNFTLISNYHIKVSF